MAGRTDSWLLSRGAVVALAAAIAAVVVVVVYGVYQQDHRQIPTAHSVEIWSALTSPTETGPVEIGPVHAQALATIVNRLGHFPNGTVHCGSDTGQHYRLTFATASGDVEVHDDVSGCLRVAISSDGSDWGARKWDPNWLLASAIRADLAGTDRR